MPGAADLGGGSPDMSLAEVQDMSIAPKQDLTVSPNHDMIVSPNDMIVTQLLNCIAFADCWYACLNIGSSPTGATCVNMCKPREKSAKTPGLFLDALTCGQKFCLGQLNGDMGAGVCAVDMTSGNFINHDNTPAFDSNFIPHGDCGECLNDVSQNFFSALATFEGQTAGQCIGTRFCNVAACQAAQNACINDP
jgi:hypothetical protein